MFTNMNRSERRELQYNTSKSLQFDKNALQKTDTKEYHCKRASKRHCICDVKSL